MDNSTAKKWLELLRVYLPFIGLIYFYFHSEKVEKKNDTLTTWQTNHLQQDLDANRQATAHVISQMGSGTVYYRNDSTNRVKEAEARRSNDRSANNDRERPYPE